MVNALERRVFLHGLAQFSFGASESHARMVRHRKKRVKARASTRPCRTEAQPSAGSSAREAIAPGVRSLRAAQHVAFYLIRKNEITILRILHPRRNANEAFEDGE